MLQGLEQGVELGELNARRQIARRQLQRRFHTILPDLETRIAGADEATLDAMLDRIVTAGSMEDFLRGL